MSCTIFTLNLYTGTLRKPAHVKETIIWRLFSSGASIISCHPFIRAHIEAKNTPLDPGEIHIYKQCAVKGLDDYWYRALVEKTLDKGKVSRFLFMSRSSRLLSRIGRTHFKYFWFPWESKKIQHDRSKMAAARESWRHSIVISCC